MILQFLISNSSFGKRYFLRFEGVGTYATITLNGKDFGRHPVGRTTLTLDVTDALKLGENKLVVKAEHPEMIADMPWVCGGCSSEWGFSEGSQPLGISAPWCWRLRMRSALSLSECISGMMIGGNCLCGNGGEKLRKDC